MATNPAQFAPLSDAALVAEVARLARCERHATAELIASLAEFDRRRLYLAEGFPSLFAYCTRHLHLSEHSAYHRIETARAALRFPSILSLLEEGALTLTSVGLLRPHLTEENHREVLKRASHLGKRAVEGLVAELHARPDVRSVVRKLPEPRVAEAVPQPLLSGRFDEDRGAPAEVGADGQAAGEFRDVGSRAEVIPAPATGVASAPLREPPPVRSRPAVVRALSPTRYQVQMTVSAETHAKLRRAQDLLRHVVPNGDPAVVFDRALTLLLRDLERAKCAATKGRVKRAQAPSGSKASPRRSRRIPADVKRAVWARDSGQCAFVGRVGRCPESGFLEYHHEVPYAAGGEATIANVSLRCRRHNSHEAERFFGAAASGSIRRRPSGMPGRAPFDQAQGAVSASRTANMRPPPRKASAVRRSLGEGGAVPAIEGTTRRRRF